MELEPAGQHDSLSPENFVPHTAKQYCRWSAEACAAELLAEVFAFELHDPAHLMQPGTHALADAVAKCFSSCRIVGSFAAAAGEIASCHPRRQVGEIRGDNGGPFVVVARVEDQA